MRQAAPHLLLSFLVAAGSSAAIAQSAPPCPEGQQPSDCRSQAPKPTPRATAEEMQKSMEAAMGSMVPMMGKVAELNIETELRMAALPETAERIAVFKRNLYDQLQKKGFTQSQAFQITLATPLPAASVGK